MYRKNLKRLIILLCMMLCIGCGKDENTEYVEDNSTNSSIITKEELESTLYEVTESANKEEFKNSEYRYGGLTAELYNGDTKYIKVGVPSEMFNTEVPISNGKQVATNLYVNGINLKLKVYFEGYNEDNGYNALDIIESTYNLADKVVASPTNTNYSGKCVIDEYTDDSYKRKAYKAENMGDIVMVASLETELHMNNYLDVEEAYRILDSISINTNVTQEEVERIQEESKTGDGFIIIDDYGTRNAIISALEMYDSTENYFTFEQLESIEELSINDNSHNGEFDLSILEYTKNLKTLNLSLCIFSCDDESTLLPGDEVIKNIEAINKLENLENFYIYLTIKPYSKLTEGNLPEGKYTIDLSVLNGLSNLKEVAVTTISLDEVLNTEILGLDTLESITSLESIILYNENSKDDRGFIPFEGYEGLVELPNLRELKVNGEQLI